MGHFAATEMRLKRVTTLVEDFALGYEQMGGFQEVFEKYVGRLVVTPDYAPYLVQIRESDGVLRRFCRLEPICGVWLQTEDLWRRNRCRRRVAAPIR
jgi:hypothetical protein